MYICRGNDAQIADRNEGTLNSQSLRQCCLESGKEPADTASTRGGSFEDENMRDPATLRNPWQRCDDNVNEYLNQRIVCLIERRVEHSW